MAKAVVTTVTLRRFPPPTRRRQIATADQIKKGAEIIGADGVRVGTVDQVEGNRIRLTRESVGQGHHASHRHYIELGFVATVEGDTVRLSANGDVAATLEEEKDGKPTY